MTTTNQLEINTIKSFAAAREDINRLYNSTKFLLEEVRKLKTRNFDLMQQVSDLSLQVTKAKYQKKTVKKVTARKVSKKSFIASKASNKLHQKACFFAKNIKPKNKKVFASKNKALNEGYKSCTCVA